VYWPTHDKSSICSRSHKAWQATGRGAKESVTSLHARCKRSNRGNDTGTVIPWRGEETRRKLSKDVKHVLEVEAHRLHLQLHLASREGHVESWLLAEHHARNDATPRDVHTHRPPPREVASPVRMRLHQTRAIL